MACQSAVIVALDFQYREQALEVADQLDPGKCRVKVGKELFTREGPGVVKALHEKGFDVFLDLKFHDIPNTVARACSVAADLGVWMVNVHASGGRRMMEAAAKAIAQTGTGTQLIAVTVLTSMERSDLVEVGLDVEPIQHVQRLAALAKDCGLHGVVCSAQEAPVLKPALGGDFKLVTPGIRPQGSETGDQRRVMTPPQAVAAGVDYMVIGRPIAQAPNPRQALQDVLSSLP
ncbi:MAG: orotidine-5'-phosphate decarboxylase [Pseudomonadales bacterium]|jgi:orotidine-5'-phosphate decarboxylase|nr:orotidine-5'-phosphate decarboxylase [Pseudomonadales bacterium]MBI26736.1 orotidine-5'-phosphate decarboxylase [Pseudomonadales bacterium]MEC8810651.1 orotidine-5'-phosphate decarboxylase [Pseudomonadota bacterium]HAG93694.1 orotidine-5'-phosphate decarboxylase [Gammaproteobacteria bacterium]HCB38871.1 orotidine-5'-phosphate decarboxylase [Gammaproteobacteria bacterium]|tara:strand:- start:1687 stop:2382 length:696 start_codon:yes stop_codon:yes gene_type:complete